MNEEESDDPVEFLEDDEEYEEYQEEEEDYEEEIERERKQQEDEEDEEENKIKIKMRQRSFNEKINFEEKDQNSKKQTKFSRTISVHSSSTSISSTLIDINPYESNNDITKKKIILPTPKKEINLNEVKNSLQTPLNERLKQSQIYQQHKGLELDRPKHWKTLTPARLKKLPSSPKNKRKSLTDSTPQFPQKIAKNNHVDLSFKPNFLKSLVSKNNNHFSIENEIVHTQPTTLFISSPTKSQSIPPLPPHQHNHHHHHQQQQPCLSNQSTNSTTIVNNHQDLNSNGGYKTSTKKFREGSLSHLFQQIIKETESLQLQFAISLPHYPLITTQPSLISSSPSKSKDLLNPRNRTKYWVDVSFISRESTIQEIEEDQLDKDNIKVEVQDEDPIYLIKNAIVIDSSCHNLSPLSATSTTTTSSTISTSSQLLSTPTKQSKTASAAATTTALITTPTKQNLSNGGNPHNYFLEKGVFVQIYFRKDRLKELRLEFNDHNHNHNHNHDSSFLIRIYDYFVLPNSDQSSKSVNLSNRNISYRLFCTQLFEKIEKI